MAVAAELGVPAAAVEKQKLVYVMNRDASSALTISSPLEAHKGSTIVFDAVGVDNGFDNPIFAFLEMDYTEIDGDPTGQALEDTPKVCVCVVCVCMHARACVCTASERDHHTQSEAASHATLYDTQPSMTASRC